MEVFIFCLIFAKNIHPHGNDQKEDRLMVVVVFRFYRRIDSSHRGTLGMAHADTSLPVHFVCKSDGSVVNADMGE